MKKITQSALKKVKNTEEQKILKDYLDYLDTLSEDEIRKLYDLESSLKEEAPIICSEFSFKLMSVIS
jgi:hypothetical protein